MAKDKKSFILYADIIHTVRKMPKGKQADLFMTILEYVNDENPQVTDLVVGLVFEPIRQQLKRDLARWTALRQKQSEYGKLGGRPRKESNDLHDIKKGSLLDERVKSLNVTVNANANVNANVSKREIIPTLDDVRKYFTDNGYSDAAANKAFMYYNSAGWKDSNGKKVKNWKQKMISVWFKEENKIKVEKHFVTMEQKTGKSGW